MWQHINMGNELYNVWAMDINVHYRTSHPLVKCTCCDRLFATPLSLKHCAYKHQDKNKKCSRCGKGFIFSSQLAAHVKTHRKLKPFVCSYIKGDIRCQKDFNYVGDLNRHEAQHRVRHQNVNSVNIRTKINKT